MVRNAAERSGSFSLCILPSADFIHYTLNFLQQQHCIEEAYWNRRSRVIPRLWTLLQESGFVPFIVQPVRSLMMGYVIVRMWLIVRHFRTPETGQRVWAPYAMSKWDRPNYHDLGSKCRRASVHVFTRVCVYLCVFAVSTLPQEGRQQASDHAAATEALQEPDHPGLQDAGAGTHQHGRGTAPRIEKKKNPAAETFESVMFSFLQKWFSDVKCLRFSHFLPLYSVSGFLPRWSAFLLITHKKWFDTRQVWTHQRQDTQKY